LGWYTLNVEFVWDEQKNETNIQKHSLDFADAPRIFAGPISSHGMRAKSTPRSAGSGSGFSTRGLSWWPSASRMRTPFGSSRRGRHYGMSETGSHNTSRTNWAQVDALTDDEIDTSDVPSLTEDFFRRATWRKPAPVRVTVWVDPDVLAWFRAQGKEGKRRMSAALRIYAEAHKGT
jgi:uncharacterized protein (DUF4415 family)